MTTLHPPRELRKTKFQFYFCHNNYRLLQSMDDHKISSFDNDLEELVYLGSAYLAAGLPSLHTLRVRLLYPHGTANGRCIAAHYAVAARHCVCSDEKELHEQCQNACAKPKVDEITAKYPKQVGRHEAPAGNDVALLTVWRKPHGWLSAYAHSDAYLDCNVQLCAECHRTAPASFLWADDLRPTIVFFHGTTKSGDWATASV